MQQFDKHSETALACDSENGKLVWHRPSVNRIDIKRTLFGAGSATDGPSGFTT